MPRYTRFYHNKSKLRKERTGQCCNEGGAENQLHRLQLQASVPNTWNCQTPEDMNCLLYCKISQQPGPSTAPLRITHCLRIQPDLSWSIFVHDRPVNISKCAALVGIPTAIESGETLSQLMTKIDQLFICSGHTESHFVKMVADKKDRIVSPDGTIAAFIDNNIVQVEGQVFTSTVRASGCELLSSSNDRCPSCKKYRVNLRAMYCRSLKQPKHDGSDTSSHVNDRYLKDPQMKTKLGAMRDRMHVAEGANKKLKDKVTKLINEQGETVDSDLHQDLVLIMRENNEKIMQKYDEGTFPRLLWDEQLKATSTKDLRQMRWHPTLIKWCLNLKLLSGAAYHALRTSGFLKLPSERTLRDYLHYFSSKPGFQSEVHQQLLEEANITALPESRRYVSLIIDEMKIKEGLVYNKHTGNIIGFTDLGDVNNQLVLLEQECEHPAIATHVLAVMVRGIFFKMEFPYAHFGTDGITADTLYPIVWEAVRRLEIDGVKVICVTADGDSSNRKFFKMHNHLELGLPVPYKAKNVFATDERWLFFIADPPHLMKTVRNCWSHSGKSGTRHMQVN